MREALLGVILYCVGLFVGNVVFSNQQEMEKILGTTYSELSSMKEECEHSLPRNQHCEASIIFLPTAIEE